MFSSNTILRPTSIEAMQPSGSTEDAEDCWFGNDFIAEVLQGPSGIQAALARNNPAPLPAAVFQRAYWEQWVPGHPIKNRSMLKIEDRTIDLYELHVEVANAGTYFKVSPTYH